MIAVAGLDRFSDAQMTRHCKSREEHAGRCQEFVRELYRAGVPESEKEDGAMLEISVDESNDKCGTSHTNQLSKKPRRG